MVEVKNLAFKSLLKITKFHTTTQYNCAIAHQKHKSNQKLNFIKLKINQLNRINLKIFNCAIPPRRGGGIFVMSERQRDLRWQKRFKNL